MSMQRARLVFAPLMKALQLSQAERNRPRGSTNFFNHYVNSVRRWVGHCHPFELFIVATKHTMSCELLAYGELEPHEAISVEAKYTDRQVATYLADMLPSIKSYISEHLPEPEPAPEPEPEPAPNPLDPLDLGT